MSKRILVVDGDPAIDSSVNVIFLNLPMRKVVGAPTYQVPSDILLKVEHRIEFLTRIPASLACPATFAVTSVKAASTTDPMTAMKSRRFIRSPRRRERVADKCHNPDICLDKLERYETRAWSRQMRAIRTFIELTQDG